MSLVMAIVLLAGLALPGTAPASEVINPHVGDHCRSCHLRVPEQGADKPKDYQLLGEEIDPTCLICHERACCTIGTGHQTHPSGIDTWDKTKFRPPATLPLSGGYITCATCHFWRRELNPAPKDYKLVRLVNISGTKIDWTVLCHDCHLDY